VKSLSAKSADIIIVDDDNDDLFFMNYAFSQLPFDLNVLTVSDAREALAYLHECQHLPSLILTDLNMPCLNGIELVNLIKRSSNHRVIPVVVLTTSPAEEDRERCYLAGANAILVKPNQLSKMTELLYSCIQVWLGSNKN
jgi:CheY-like chemotaxis protein